MLTLGSGVWVQMHPLPWSAWDNDSDYPVIVLVSQRHCQDEIGWYGGYRVPCDSQNLFLLWSTDPSIERCKIDAECFSISRIFTVRKDSLSSHSRTLQRDKEIGVVLFGTTEITVGKKRGNFRKERCEDPRIKLCWSLRLLRDSATSVTKSSI